jgi:sugar lactone lactonase YvrE
LKILIIIILSIFVAACGDGGVHSTTASNAMQLADVTSMYSFPGNRGNYQIVATSDGYVVTDSAGTTTKVTNASAIKFGDITVNLQIGAKSQTISTADLRSLIELYIAYFNRVPDADGLAYWIDQFKSGQSLEQIGTSFYNAAVQYSALTGYTATMSNADFVKVIYKNVLGRDTVDQDGLNYWSTSLANGSQTRGTLIAAILNSAHTFKGDATYGWVADLLDNKVIFADFFTIQQGMNYNSADVSIANTVAMAAAITATDTTAATKLIGAIDSGFSEIDASKLPQATVTISTISSIAGGPGCENCAATSIAIGVAPLAVDGNGNLLVGDTMNHRIRRIDATGKITTIAGTGQVAATDTDPATQNVNGGAGYAGVSGSGGLAVNASLDLFNDIAVDGAGNIYINENSGCIRKIDHATGIIDVAAIACGNGGSGTNADGSPVNGIIRAFHMTVDSAGNIYFSDLFDRRVRRIDHETGILSTVAGTGVGGYTGDGGLATNARIEEPDQIAVDNKGNLYISDTVYNVVRRVDGTTGVITTVYNKSVKGIAVDNSDNLYLTPSYSEGASVVQLNLRTGALTPRAGSNTGGTGVILDSGDGGPAINAHFGAADRIALDASGNLFVADWINWNIRRIDSASGLISTIAGDGYKSYSGDNGAATSAQLNEPTGVAHDAANNLYIADSNNNRIRRIDSVTGIITTVAGTGIAGSSGNGGLATSAQLKGPTHIAVDSVGNIYFADQYNGQVRRVDKTTHVIQTVINGNGGTFDGIALDQNDNLYVSDSTLNVVNRVDAKTGIVTTVAGNGSPACKIIGVACQLNGPRGLAIDSNGVIYIADFASWRIIRLDQATGQASVIYSSPSVNGNGGVSPIGLAIDNGGNLLFTTSNFGLYRLDAISNKLNIIIGTTHFGFAGDGGPALVAKMNKPVGVTVKTNGNIYIADSSNNHIREVKQ